MIDSHCHLDHEPLLSDLTNVIKRSREIGIKKLLTILLAVFEELSNVFKSSKTLYILSLSLIKMDGSLELLL